MRFGTSFGVLWLARQSVEGVKNVLDGVTSRSHSRDICGRFDRTVVPTREPYPLDFFAHTRRTLPPRIPTANIMFKLLAVLAIGAAAASKCSGTSAMCRFEELVLITQMPASISSSLSRKASRPPPASLPARVSTLYSTRSPLPARPFAIPAFPSFRLATGATWTAVSSSAPRTRTTASSTARTAC